MTQKEEEEKKGDDGVVESTGNEWSESELAAAGRNNAPSSFSASSWHAALAAEDQRIMNAKNDGDNEVDGDSSRHQQREQRELALVYHCIQQCPYIPNDVKQAALAALEDHQADVVAKKVVAPQVGSDQQPTILAKTAIVSSTSPTATTRRDDNVPSNYASSAPTAAVPPPPEVATKKIAKTTRRSSHEPDLSWSSFIVVGYMLRTLLMDLPLLIIFVLYASMRWLDHVRIEYIGPLLDVTIWNNTRSDSDVMYYARTCTVEDATTTNPMDLIFPVHGTPQDAYEHQLLHGFTIFPRLLSESTATQLRDFISDHARNLNEERSIWVLESEHRYSFHLGPEEPSIRQAIREVTTHKQFRPALEKILGPNPAFVKLTMVTSQAGAKAQEWHPDVSNARSALLYARSFAASYSVFIQLQNTTPGMGATGVCPGSHYCYNGGMDEACFQVVTDPQYGHWAVGDAVLMNLQSWHRGEAFTDPTAPDRVMLILSFNPKPQRRRETRMIPHGSIKTLRWDLWGHTLDDLTHLEHRMVQPWSTLRSLGLMKLPKSEWGVDYVTSAVPRIANGDNGFREDQFPTFIERGGVRWIPRFLQAGGDSFLEYFTKTFELCYAFVERACFTTLALYVLLFAFLSIFPRKKHRLLTLGSAFRRCVVLAGAVFVVFLAALRHVDRSTWASDIRSNRLFASTIQSEVPYYSSRPPLTTLPTRYDVLVESRFGSDELAMYNDWINGHAGNRYYLQLLRDAAATIYPSDHMQREVASYVLSAVHAQHGRFLFQSVGGYWTPMTPEDAQSKVENDISLTARPHLQTLMRAVRHTVSDVKYGVWGVKALAVKHAVPYLQKLALAAIQRQATPQNISNPKSTTAATLSFVPRVSPLATMTTTTIGRTIHRGQTSGDRSTPSEPYPGAWMSAGDTIEGLYDGWWYPALLKHVSPLAYFYVVYPDGDAQWLTVDQVRPFQPYRAGESGLQCLVQGAYYNCDLVEEYSNEDWYDEQSPSYLAVVHPRTGSHGGTRRVRVAMHEVIRAHTEGPIETDSPQNGYSY